MRQAYDYWQDQPGSYPRSHGQPEGRVFRLHALGAAAGQSPSGGAPGPETNEGGKGGHGGTTSVTGNGPTAHGCRTAEHRMGGHCAAPRARRREGGGWARSAAQSPITKRNPPTLGQTARCKLPHGSTPLTWDTSGQKNVGGRVEIRGTPEAGSIPRARLRLPCQRADGPRRFRRRPHRLACNVPRSGRREARRTPRTRLHRLTPSTAPSRATHRTAGDEPVGSAVARFRLGTHGFETLRIDTSRT